MKQTLSLKLGQQLTMTPQLQQAIKLLQLSAMDLKQEIQATLEVNPMLELEEDTLEQETQSTDDSTEAAMEISASADASTDDVDPSAAEGEDEMSSAPELEQTIPEDLPIDSNWEDVYQPPTPSSAPASDDTWSFDERNSAEETLQDYLHWQLNLTRMSDTDRAIATSIIDAINPDGMLEASIEELLEGFDLELEIEGDEIAAVLKRIQQFDPTGVGARNISECLTLQLNQLDQDTPWRAEAITIVTEHLDLLGAKDFNTLRRKTKLSDDHLAAIATLIQSLNPRPGAAIASGPADYIIPDVLVRKDKGRWLVELNPESTPKIRINQPYAAMVKRADNSPDNTYLRDNLQEARWFIKSLQSRHETLLKVATKIVEYQRGFLEYGEEAMKPLVLHDIAEAVEMHESTISRVTSRKYLHTPRGIFELKYFFSSHVGTSTGGEVSSTAIRALIKKLTSDENPKKPLSDNKIAAILADQDIKVARRTVAKYRESMAIPPSNERKRLV